MEFPQEKTCFRLIPIHKEVRGWGFGPLLMGTSTGLTLNFPGAWVFQMKDSLSMSPFCYIFSLMASYLNSKSYFSLIFIMLVSCDIEPQTGLDSFIKRTPPQVFKCNENNKKKLHQLKYFTSFGSIKFSVSILIWPSFLFNSVLAEQPWSEYDLVKTV